jgi:MFS family permease
MLLSVGCAIAGIGFLAFGRVADRWSANRVIGAGVLVLVGGSFASALTVGWAPAFVLASSILGMGASGARLGAELALIRWLGRDRAAVAAALGETTVLGGRALGAPAAGSFGAAYGGAYAFGAMGLVAMVASGVLLALAAVKLRPRLAESLSPIQVPTTEPALPQSSG